MPSANHDPIFIGSPLHWTAVLTNQIFPRSGGIATGTTPVLLGSAGTTGGVISSITLEFTGDHSPNVCVLFSLKEGESSLVKRCETAIEGLTNTSNTSIIYSKRFSLPDEEPFEGRSAYLLKMAANESLYVALISPEPNSKIIIHAVGGLYDAL